MAQPYVSALADRNNRRSVDGSLSANPDFIFKAADIAGRDTLPFIFEGVKEGKGRLDVLILSKSNGQVLGSGPLTEI